MPRFSVNNAKPRRAGAGGSKQKWQVAGREPGLCSIAVGRSSLLVADVEFIDEAGAGPGRSPPQVKWEKNEIKPRKRRRHIRLVVKRAAELGTTVSALVTRFLTELAAGESDAERLNRTFLRLSSQLIIAPIEFIDENGGGSGVRLRRASTPSKVAIIGARKIFPVEFKHTTVLPSVARRA